MGLTLPRVSHGIDKRMVYNLDVPFPRFYWLQFSEFRVTYTGKEIKHIITCIEKLFNEASK